MNVLQAMQAAEAWAVLGDRPREAHAVVVAALAAKDWTPEAITAALQPHVSALRRCAEQLPAGTPAPAVAVAFLEMWQTDPGAIKRQVRPEVLLAAVHVYLTPPTRSGGDQNEC